MIFSYIVNINKNLKKIDEKKCYNSATMAPHFQLEGGGGGGGKNFIKVFAGERVRNINMVGRGVVLLREVILLERVMGF